MSIKKKSDENLQAQVEGFLEFARKNNVISENVVKEIIKIMGGDNPDKKGFFERLSKKFGNEIDISDKGGIGEFLKKKHIDFDKIWEDYVKYLKVKHMLEKYVTSSDELNDKIIKVIIDNYSEDAIQKVKIFISSDIYNESYLLGKIKNEQFLGYYIKNIQGNDDLKFLLDNLSLDVLSDIRLHDSLNTDGPYKINLDEFKNVISLLDEFGIDCKKLSLGDLLDENIEWYVKIISDSDVEGFRRDFDEDEENDELKNIFFQFKDLGKFDLLKYCIKCGPYYIDKVMSKWPDIHYENNSGYTSKLVHMFGGDWDNNKLMREYLGGFEFDFLSYLWTIFWTSNWKKNIDLAFEKGFINDKKIIDYDNRYWSDNDYIAHLKMIDNKILDLLINRGVSYEDFKDFLQNTYSMKNKNLELILVKYPDITIKELNLLRDVLHSREFKNLEIIFEHYPDIKFDELILLENENTHVLDWAKFENLNRIFNQYPDIKFDELISLETNDTHVLYYAVYQNLNKIFEHYPDIKLDELISLENDKIHILRSAMPENLDKIFEQYPEIKLDELISLENSKVHILSYAKLENLNKIFEQYPEIKLDELISLINNPVS